VGWGGVGGGYTLERVADLSGPRAPDKAPAVSLFMEGKKIRKGKKRKKMRKDFFFMEYRFSPFLGCSYELEGAG